MSEVASKPCPPIIVTYSRKKKTIPLPIATTPPPIEEEVVEEKEEKSAKKKPKQLTLYETLLLSNNGKSKAQQKKQQEENAAPKAKRQKQERKKEGGQQLFLDFGQNDFVSTTCPICGLEFAKGTEDEKLHAAFHKKETAPIQCSSWKAKSKIIVEKTDTNNNEFCIICVPISGRELSEITDKPLHRAVEELVSMIDRALGFADESPKSEKSHGLMKMYAYIDKQNRALGAVIVERISVAHKMIPSSTASEGGVSCSNADEKVVAGVSRVWVHQNARRKQIATELLDALRSDFIYGYQIPKELLAFSQPTSDGMKFFKRYSGTNEFLVYS